VGTEAEACMFMARKTKAWYDGTCNRKMVFACQVTVIPSPNPPGPPPPLPPSQALATGEDGCASVSLATLVVASGLSSINHPSLEIAVDNGATLNVDTISAWSGITCSAETADKVTPSGSYASKFTCTSNKMGTMLHFIPSATFTMCPACPGENVVLSVGLTAPIGPSPDYNIRRQGSKAPDGSTVTIALAVPYPGSGDRTVLGRAMPLASMGGSWCSRPAVAASLTLDVLYATNPHAFQTKTCSESRTSTTAVDSATGRFALTAHLPPFDTAVKEAKVTLTSTDTSSPFHAVTAYLNNAISPAVDKPGDDWTTAFGLLPTLILVPASVSPMLSVSGTVGAISAALSNSLDASTFTMLTVSAYLGVDNPGVTAALDSTTVGSDGSFSLSSLTPLAEGMVTLVVTSSSESSLSISGDTASVLYNAAGVNLQVLVESSNSGTDLGTYAVLSHLSSDSIAMDLQLKIQMQGASFDVDPQNKQQGGATWSQSSGSQTIDLSEAWVAAASYALFATYKKMNCVGYDKDKEGGGKVNCYTADSDGCEPGKGYCYSSDLGDSCNQCVLYNAGPGETLCVDGGYPQGTPEWLPGGSSWSTTCQEKWENADGPAKIDRPCSSRATRSEPMLRIFAQGKLVYRMPLVGALLQEDAGGSRAMWFMCIRARANCGSSGCDYIHGAPSVRPVIQMKGKPGLTEAGYIDLVQTAGNLEGKCDAQDIIEPLTSCSAENLMCVREYASLID